MQGEETRRSFLGLYKEPAWNLGPTTYKLCNLEQQDISTLRIVSSSEKWPEKMTYLTGLLCGFHTVTGESGSSKLLTY